MLRKLAILLGCIIVSLTAGALGTLATAPNIPSWYTQLDKPFFTPPNWLFGPVWTILYILMGIALYLIITSSVKKPKKDAYFIFGIQLIFNTLWSFTFFGLHLVQAAVAIILILFIVIVVMIVKFWPFSPLAAKLLMPYAFWVAFATALNIAIALLN